MYNRSICLYIVAYYNIDYIKQIFLIIKIGNILKTIYHIFIYIK